MPSQPNNKVHHNGERRKSKRFSTILDIEYRTLTHNPIYGNVSCRDLSKGGLSFHSKNHIEKGTNVELKMNVPGDNMPVFANGTVAWAEGSKTGVKLTRIERADQVRILEHIYKEWLQSKLEGGGLKPSRSGSKTQDMK